MIKRLEVGSAIEWTSAAGLLSGEVSKVWLALNAAGNLVPWILVNYSDKNGTQTAMLCATEQNLLMMKVKAA
jgi:hypothetical protein